MTPSRFCRRVALAAALALFSFAQACSTQVCSTQTGSTQSWTAGLLRLVHERGLLPQVLQVTVGSY